MKLRTVLRRAFGSRGNGQTLAFTADSEGFNVKARQNDIVIEYRGDSKFVTESLLPFSTFLRVV
jgi:hypothetical protein